jgi:rhodanese-related sulfurtransferase
MKELDRERPITVYCQAGLRGYVAIRMLMQHGFKNVRNVKGGYGLAQRFGIAAAPRR